MIPLVYFLILLLNGSAWAIDTPLRDPRELLEVESEWVERVQGSRVILLDYELIRKDFPETSLLSNADIDQWVLDKVSYVSVPQAAQERVNSKIPITGERRKAYRPKDYGRALVFEAGAGLIDAKGAGTLYPGGGDHRNGLASLGEAIREYLYERLAVSIFEHSRAETKTVRNYGVIDLGFDIKSDEGRLSRAGLVLRQAHVRAEGSYSLLADIPALKIEKILRPYGVTSAGAHRNKWDYEWLNIQGTREGAILDFGGFLTVEKFSKPMVPAFRDLAGGPVLMSVAQVAELQPDPRLRIPLSVWGSTATGQVDPAFDNPWIWSHELAAALREGRAQREHAEQHVRNMLGPVEQHLANTPCPAAFAGTRE